jgi:hypothetical protein
MRILEELGCYLLAGQPESSRDIVTEVSATGSPAHCAAAVRNQLAPGCDGVILHGCTPDELLPVVEAYRVTK